MFGRGFLFFKVVFKLRFFRIFFFLGWGNDLGFRMLGRGGIVYF